MTSVPTSDGPLRAAEPAGRVPSDGRATASASRAPSGGRAAESASGTPSGGRVIAGPPARRGLPRRGAGPAAERRGLFTSFFAFGAFWGAWVAALPAVQRSTGVDDGQLGLALGAIAVGALPAMPLAGRAVDRLGPSRLLPAALLAFAAVSALPALVGGPLVLVALLALLGTSTGTLDVVANAAAAGWERTEGRKVLTACHGFFSLGVLVGSVCTGVARTLGAGPGLVLGSGALVLAVAGLSQPAYRSGLPARGRAAAEGSACAGAVEAGAVAAEAARAGAVAAGSVAAGAVDGRGGRSPGHHRPATLVLALGAVTGTAFLVEDAVQSWSSLLLERGLSAPPGLSSLAPGLFAATMAAGRFGAHALARPGSDAVVVRGGSALLAVGVVVLGLAPTVAVGLVAAVVAGLGVSVVAPTLLSAIGARSAEGRQGADLAVATTFGYVGFLLGPALVGGLSALTSLGTALAMLGGLAAFVAVLGPVLLHRSDSQLQVPEAVAPRRISAPSGR